MIGAIKSSAGSMSKQAGKDQFLMYCRKRFNFIYKYYYKECSRDTMVFSCPYHGKQSVDSTRHFNGLGCRHCLAEADKTYEDFLSLSKKRFGTKYTYPRLVPGYNLQSRVNIKCPQHGTYTKAVYAHLNGEGCPYCAKGMLSKSQFLKLANKAHGDKYDYSAVPDGVLTGKVKIRCKRHGWFKQYPQSHAAESGCMDCAYTDRNPGMKHFFLYLFECKKGNMRFYKPGLANDVIRRGKEHARALADGWEIKLLSSYKLSEHHGAYSTELYVLNNLPGRPVSKRIMKVGYTETKYNKLSQSEMKKQMEKLIRVYLRKSKKHVHTTQKFK